MLKSIGILWCLLVVCLLSSSRQAHSLSSVSPPSTAAAATKNNVLILDHININHEKGRHDWVLGFYQDFLSCAVDPRKAENLEAKKGTIWMNIGANQFHLPQAEQAQVLDGTITLVYPEIEMLVDRYKEVEKSGKLKGSKFALQVDSSNGLDVTDPWGGKFILVKGDSSHRDSRGTQPGSSSLGYSMSDVTIHTPSDCNLPGILRFYEQILGATCIEDNSDAEDCIQIAVGPLQTLTFRRNPSTNVDSHVDLRDLSEEEDDIDGVPCNYGPHISMYVSDLPAAYERADKLGLTYVNRRFKRRAYTKEEAMKQCMFRCLDIVDPENTSAGVILRLEHEVRSVVKPDGTKYKSCPFDEIPPG
jgi:catechol 2,3-dioxygenase-like lactoylglutathione lyase family enzyme